MEEKVKENAFSFFAEDLCKKKQDGGLDKFSGFLYNIFILIHSAQGRSIGKENVIMRKIRILALLLCLALLLPTLVACGGGGTSESKPSSGSQSQGGESSSESESEGRDWSKVNFDGEDLIINVNIYQNAEQTFRPADIYSRGPDSLVGADEVEKLIYDRNLNLTESLGINVTWEETDEAVGSSQAIIEQFVKTSTDNSPDLFITDVYDVIHAMLTNSLWNVHDTSDGQGGTLESYFDFSHETWFEEYMLGTSLSHDKRYVLVSDYFIDVIRFSYVLFVNRGMFDEVMQGQYINVHDLYEYVKQGEWDYDMLIQYIEIAHLDTVNKGFTDKEDERNGLAASAHMQRAFTWSNGLSILEWDDEIYNSNPYVIENHPDYFAYAEKFSELYNTPGMYYTGDDAAAVQASTTLFLDGTYLFALSMMGEMESETVRNSDVNKGVLPLPKFDQDLQSDYHTLVHDQVDIACILNNARHFSAASAYLQKASEDSVSIMKEYYDKSLKLKYNEDKDTQEVLDLIHDRIVTPFELIIARLVVSGGQYLPGAPYSGTEMYNMVHADAKEQKTAFASSWAAAYDGWCQNLEHLLDLFENLE